MTNYVDIVCGIILGVIAIWIIIEIINDATEIKLEIIVQARTILFVV